MKLKYIELDETEYWREDIQKVAGKISKIYLFDAEQVVHLCELTPSYELWPVYLKIEKPITDEQEADISDGDDMLVQYQHCSTIDNQAKDVVSIREFEDMDEAIEFFMGNHCL